MKAQANQTVWAFYVFELSFLTSHYIGLNYPFIQKYLDDLVTNVRAVNIV